MTDYDRTLKPGEQQMIRRGPKSGRWKNRTIIDLKPGDSATIDADPLTPPPPPPDEPPPPPDEPEPEPEPEPPPPPPATSEVVGYGVITQRGTQTVSPVTLAELKAAASQSDRLIKLTKPIDLAGSVSVSGSKVTIEGQGEASMLGNGWIKVSGNDVTLRNVAVWGGDEASSADADPFNVNGTGSAPVSRIVVDHCLFLWGIDVTAVFLNNVTDFTMQYTVVAEGLYLSKHPEASASQGGHSMGLNVTNIAGPGQPAPARGTIYRSALINSADRNGRFMGSDQIDLVECLLYGWQKTQGFHGAPRSMNVVNNLIRKGPNGSAIPPFALRTSADEPKLYPDAVYVAGNVADGFSFTAQSGLRSSPKHPLSVQTSRAPTLTEALSWIGPTDRGKQMQRLVADVIAGRSEYPNGVGKGGKEYRGLL